MKETNNNPKRSNPFTLPDNYFEEFHRNLMQQLPAKEYARQPQKKEFSISNIRYWGYAAAIALMFVTGAAIYQYNQHQTTIAKIEAESNEMIETIFDNYTIDDYNVYCYLTSNDINF